MGDSKIKNKFIFDNKEISQITKKLKLKKSVLEKSNNDYYKLFTTIIATGFFIFFKRYVYIAR